MSVAMAAHMRRGRGVRDRKKKKLSGNAVCVGPRERVARWRWWVCVASADFRYISSAAWRATDSTL